MLSDENASCPVGKHGIYIRATRGNGGNEAVAHV